MQKGARAFARAVLVAAALHFAGLLLFNEGFFLTRVELPHKSSCAEPPRDDAHAATKSSGEKRTASTHGGCWTRPRFKRAVVLVIDALRYDFAAWDPDAEHRDAQRPFENKMPAIRDLLMLRPAHSMLVPFFADPPTTTMQRLKGIVTGGLPTFMEIKDDVASEGIEITEDNFIDLLINDGTRNITFMGDDTWTVLFPNQFNRAYPYPSFNVKDLHTVDEGVLKHLIPEMRRDDWSFLVGHFLGVDHCGHRYGPDNDHMTRKLLQMNQAIDDVVRTMDEGGFEDTVLLIFGDHGMTEDGNHGGATEEEVGAALFVYASSPLLLGSAHADDAAAVLRKDLMEELSLLHVNDDSHAAETATSDQAWQLLRRPNVQQIDLAPTLALLLGLPIPFGNLGAIVPELFFVGESWLERYRSLNEAMEVNVGQVLRYLSTYGDRAGAQQGVSRKLLDDLRNETENAFRRMHAAEENPSGLSEDDIVGIHRETFAVAQRVLHQASAEGRSLWTQFNLKYMGTGFLLALSGLLIMLASFRLPFVQSVLCSTSWADCVVCGLATILQMLSRLSNSYIVSEARGVVFITTTVAVYAACIGLRSRQFFAASAALVAALCSRCAVELNDIQWWRGQEAVPGDLAHLWFWAFCLLPSLLVLVGMVAWLQHRSRASWFIVCIVGLQGTATLSHWLAQSLGVFPTGRLWLPRFVYALGVPCACVGLARGSMAAIAPHLAALLFPYLLLVGPTSPSACVLFLAHIFALTQYRARRGLEGSAIVALLWSMASMSYFFATGHESFFNKLHYASPFVGFDEYEYFRGGLMMGSNTFGVYMVLVLLVAQVARSASERAFFLLVFGVVQACRSIVMTAFVAAERRHLMVWAIFAPKYVFDGVTLLVVDVVTLLLTAKMVFSKVGNSTKSAATT